MTLVRRRHRRLLVALPAALLLVLAAYFVWPARGDLRLRAYVHGRPPAPLVFTSRSEPASLRAAADEGEGFVYPGQGLWQAREGRLRLLKPNGTVHELTWGKQLADGSTLIDVMSPSVSNDGKRILFAGRKGPPDPGRFRLYEINVDGSGLRQLTGGPDDEGCTALPPMRYRSPGDSTLIPDEERRRIDYDDIDPVELNFPDRRIAFASSRTPDLGRGHARRATNIWWMHADGRDKQPLTANRYNDRWPFLLSSNYVAFSLWSHNQEVVTADKKDIQPWDSNSGSARKSIDSWLGAFIQPGGGNFGMLLKPGVPVWRPRPLFNGKIVFQSESNDADGSAEHDEVFQAEPGLLLHSPSAETVETTFRRPHDLTSPCPDINSQRLSRATPSACPDGHVVLAAKPLRSGPSNYGIWIGGDDWSPGNRSELMLLFDDPDMVDAEPVAVYARRFDRVQGGDVSPPAGEPPAIELANGTTYRGPSGTLFGSNLYLNQHDSAPGQMHPSREQPYFIPPPQGFIDHIRIYASYRDRFDDPKQPRIPGGWELLVKAPVNGDSFGAQIPTGIPTVLAGFDRDGKIVSWRGTGASPPRFLAIAGDHYSAARLGGKHFCIGCHPGHSGLTPEYQNHHERQR